MLPTKGLTVKAVFFDLVGTLVTSTQPIGEQYAYWARRHGAGAADPVSLGQSFSREMRAAPPMAFPGLADMAEVASVERAWWRSLVRKVVGECGLDGVLRGQHFDAFFADLYDHFTTSNAWMTYSDARPALTALKQEGNVVGLITNYDTRVYAVLESLGLSALFDSVTIPALAGAAKPDREIFEHALRQHDLEAASAVYVGDEVRDDYEGAQGAGIKALLIDREGKHAGSEYARIGSLAELPEH